MLEIIHTKIMKKNLFYLKIIGFILVVINGVSFTKLNDHFFLPTFIEDDYVLVEKNFLNESFISYLYRNNDNTYFSVIYDCNKEMEVNITDLVKEDKLIDYNRRVDDLIYLKYPKFIANELINGEGKRAYLLRDNELVIYFNGYNIKPSLNEILFLRVNYNEIKDYLNFTVLLDTNYENESGYNYSNSKKAVAITFDDSPNLGKTNQILKSLQDNYFHATFFITGSKALKNKDLLINIKNSGNEIGSHSFNHLNISKFTNEELINDYQMVNDIYKSLFHSDLKLFRPPYGLIKDNQLNILDTAVILWSLDTLDWQYKNKDYLVNYVVNNIKDGDIILFHDSYNSTVRAIEELLPILYSKGYQVMSVSELFELKGVMLNTKEIYHRVD